MFLVTGLITGCDGHTDVHTRYECTYDEMIEMFAKEVDIFEKLDGPNDFYSYTKTEEGFEEYRVTEDR